MKMKFLTCLSIALIFLVAVVHAETTNSDSNLNPRLSTDQVENQITLDKKANPLYESRLLAPLRDWRDGVAKKTGFNWSLDYSALFMGVSDSPGEDSASGGIARLFGFWDLADRDGPNRGSLNWKIEHRHKYADIPPSALGFESGYAGLFEPPFNDSEGQLTNLYWKQYMFEGKWAAVAGFLDPTDFVDVYLLASPWTGFNNFVFSTGSAAMDLPNNATLGLGAGGMISKSVYLQAGFSDANADPTSPFEGIANVVDESDFFKWVEVGFSPGQDQIYFDNLHVTFWHIDQRANGTPSGWGLNASWQKWIGDKWLPFIRGGYADDSGSLLEKSVSLGVGYQPVPLRGVIGFGFNWGKPNPVSFADADDQYTTELFWRYQLTRELAITPSLQYIIDPALHPDQDSLWAYALRLRLAL